MICDFLILNFYFNCFYCGDVALSDNVLDNKFFIRVLFRSNFVCKDLADVVLCLD